MSNSNPFQARLAKRARKPAGNLEALQELLWGALLVGQDVLDDATEEETQLRAIHAISQAAGQYARLIEIGELESRLAALEAARELPHA